ncbi:class I SAM-dependent methyltransferase [Kribbella sp. DT2]|uniref:class I SAM-dependent methyltransferase n=1 Tax=Kribbella sp. DT2 TaxID=3393427 RepID=UPI003CFA81D3
MSRQRSHPVFARVYARLRPAMDRQGAAEHRARLLDGAAGLIVEVGAGEGANFAHYPPAVTEVVAVEPDPYLHARAARRAADGTLQIEVVEGAAERLPIEDGTADVVVMCLVLCSVTNQAAALAEAFRVLRPGGELRFYEHVAAAPDRRLARVQRVADATVWPWLMGGCHVGRDTAAAITAAGFAVEELDRFDFPPGQPSPAAPHMLGRAVREPTA